MVSRARAIGVVVIIVVVAIIGGAVWYYTLPGPTPTPFSMQVTSRPTYVAGVVPSFAGQRCVFLVVVADEGQGSGKGEAVDISATAPGSTVTVYPQAITPGEVAEVTVIPDTESTGKTLTVTVRGERGGLKQTETRTVEVVEPLVPGMEDELGALAAEMRDKFIPWLAANHPELGITSRTEWDGIMIRPLYFVVQFHLFFSEDWEMGVTWHVTIPPDDYTRIYLRHRFTEARPSYAFEISSVEEQEEPHAIEVPEWV